MIFSTSIISFLDLVMITGIFPNLNVAHIEYTTMLSLLDITCIDKHLHISLCLYVVIIPNIYVKKATLRKFNAA